MQHRAHGEEVGRGAHVMHPDRVRAGVRRPADRGQRRRPAIAGPATGDRTEEVLARDGQQQRAAERVEQVEPPQHRDRLRRSLGEVRPWIEQQLLGVHPGVLGDRDPLPEEVPHIDDDVLVEAGVEQRLLRLGARVHQHQAGARRRADVRQRELPQPGDVVDELRAGRDRRLRDRRLVGVDGDDHVELARDPLDHGHHARGLLVGGHRRTAAERRLAADVDDPRARRDQLARPRDARLDVGQLAGVGERVRRGVDDAHQQRRARERDPRPAHAQRACRSDHPPPTTTPSALASARNSAASAR